MLRYLLSNGDPNVKWALLTSSFALLVFCINVSNDVFFDHIPPGPWPLYHIQIVNEGNWGDIFSSHVILMVVSWLYNFLSRSDVITNRRQVNTHVNKNLKTLSNFIVFNFLGCQKYQNNSCNYSFNTVFQLKLIQAEFTI